MFTRDTVTIVTATTGHPHLARCLQSVQGQTYPRVEHFLIADGAQHQAKMHQALSTLGSLHRKLAAMPIPHSTGRSGWCGHRIYAAASFLCNTEFVCFLDEDNWLQPDHVQSLMDAIKATGSTWAFSLRQIFDPDGVFIAPDLCESLGNLHPVATDESRWHIDMNCYLLRRDVAVAASAAMYRPVAPVSGDPGADRLLTRFLLEQFPAVCCNLRHTLNYTAGSRPDSVTPGFFLHGNDLMRNRYPSGLPWESLQS